MISCLDSDEITVVDLATRSVLQSIDLPGVSPFRTEISQDGTRAVVGMVGSGFLGRLAVLDLQSLSVSNHWASSGLAPIGFGITPGIGVVSLVFPDFALSADGDSVVVLDRSFRRIFGYATSNGSQLFQLDTGDFSPNRVDISPGDSFAVVSLTDSAQAGPGALARFDLSGGGYQTYPLSEYVHLGDARVTPEGTRAPWGPSPEWTWWTSPPEAPRALRSVACSPPSSSAAGASSAAGSRPTREPGNGNPGRHPPGCLLPHRASDSSHPASDLFREPLGGRGRARPLHRRLGARLGLADPYRAYPSSWMAPMPWESPRTAPKPWCSARSLATS